MTDEIFDTTDNLCVIWVDSSEQLEQRKGDVDKFINYFLSLDLPVDVTFMYSVRYVPIIIPCPNHQTIAVGRSSPLESLPDSEDQRNALTVVVYKGQRKFHFFGFSEPPSHNKELFDIQTVNIKEFFNPISEEDLASVGDNEGTTPQAIDQGPVESVSYKTFEEKVSRYCYINTII